MVILKKLDLKKVSLIVEILELIKDILEQKLNGNPAKNFLPTLLQI